MEEDGTPWPVLEWNKGQPSKPRGYQKSSIGADLPDNVRYSGAAYSAGDPRNDLHRSEDAAAQSAQATSKRAATNHDFPPYNRDDYSPVPISDLRPRCDSLELPFGPTQESLMHLICPPTSSNPGLNQRDAFNGTPCPIVDKIIDLEAQERVHSLSPPVLSSETTAQANNLTKEAEEEFLAKVATVHGEEVDLEHNVCGRPISLYTLWKVVNCHFEGANYVDDCQLWPMVATLLGLSPVEHQYAPWEVRSLYMDFLLRVVTSSTSLKESDVCHGWNPDEASESHQQSDLHSIPNEGPLYSDSPSILPTLASDAPPDPPVDASCWTLVCGDPGGMAQADWDILRSLGIFIRNSTGHEVRGTGIYIWGFFVAFHHFYRTVKERGGYVNVTRGSHWDDVGLQLGFSSERLEGLADVLRKHYEQYLLTFERWGYVKSSQRGAL